MAWHRQCSQGGVQVIADIGDIADGDIIERAAAGEADGFAVLVARHRSKLTRAAERITGSREDAEDVVQEALLRAWQQASRYDRHRGLVSAWLVTMVRSASIDLYRRRSAISRQPTQDITAAPQFSEATVSPRCVRLLRSSVARLPSRERAVIDLAYFEGLSQSEIAKATSLPLGTVKSRLIAAVKHLRLAVPVSSIEKLVVDRPQLERERISTLLNERLLSHEADMYFVDELSSDGVLTRAYWGHVDPPKHDYLSNIWRFAPGTADHRHPARQAIEENRLQFVAFTSEDWKQEIAISQSHLVFMRSLMLESLITEPLIRNGTIVGAVTLVRTSDSQRHFTSLDAVHGRLVAGEVADVIAGFDRYRRRAPAIRSHRRGLVPVGRLGRRRHVAG